MVPSACSRHLQPLASTSLALQPRLSACKAAWGRGKAIAEAALQGSSPARHRRHRRPAAAAAAAAAAAPSVMAGAGAAFSTFFSTSAWVQGSAVAFAAYLAYFAVLAKLAPP